MAKCLVKNLSFDCIEDCVQNKVNVSAALRVFQWNIRGMNQLDKFDNIKEFLHRYKSPFDVLIVGETWVKEGCTELYGIEGYNAVFSSRSGSHGGLAVYFRYNMKCDVTKNANINGCHYISLHLQLAGKPIDLVAMYRPPSYSFGETLGIIDSIFSGLASEHVILAGDLNIPVNNTMSPIVQEYLRLLDSFNVQVTNTVATRPSSGNILDHMICTTAFADTLLNETISTEASDHSIVVSSFNWHATKKLRVLEKQVVDHQRLNSLFSSVLENMVQDMNADEKIAFITDKFNEIKNSVTKTVSVEAKIKGHCPWMTLDLWKLLAIKEKLLKKSRTNPFDMQIKSLLKHASKKVQSKKEECKRNYYYRQLSSSSTKQCWRCLNEILGKASGNAKEIKLNIEGTEITNPSTVNYELNKHFCTVGSNLASTITSDRNVFKFNTLRRIDTTMYLHPTTSEEVLLLINKLDCSKSPGPDNITAATLKNHKLAFSCILRDVFNEIILTGRYPDQLKTARVVPIFKSGSPTDVNNYRPISVLSVLNKILEQLIGTRIKSFMNSLELLYKNQYGFRRGSSTLTATSELLDDIYQDLDGKRFNGTLFLDLKKAFDVINHGLLLQKLERYGIRGNALNLLRSYLSNRMQFVNSNGVNGDSASIDTGVPQGSVLGPLLFIVFINDLSRVRLFGKVRLFADDTVITYSHKDAGCITQMMQADLQILNEYFTSNLLFLNLSKTVFMIFHSPQRTVPALPAVAINNTEIQKVSSFKYLGLVLDETLNWKPHIDQLKKKIAPACGVLRKISSFVPFRWLKSLYASLIHSRLQYLVINWGTASKVNLRELQTLQNRSLRTILRKPVLYPRRSLYNDVNHSFLTVRALHMFQIYVHMHNIMYNPATHHNFNPVRVEHARITRQTGDLRTTLPHTEFGKRCLSYSGCYQYNKLPDYIKQSSSQITFKLQLKSHLKQKIEQYLH